MEDGSSNLVSVSATPPISSLDGELFGEIPRPTLSQQAAINELKEYSEEAIFAWLAFARSLEHDFRYRNVPGGLSCQQVNAVSALTDCSDSDIIVWLQCLMHSGNANIHRGVGRSPKTSPSSSARHSKRFSSKSTSRSSVNSLAPSTFSVSTGNSTARSSLGYASSLPDLPEISAENETFGHTHWCSECGKYVNSCDGWKRHMKEHETFYPCMPFGPEENDEGIPKCAFCGIQYPDRNHLARHNVMLCMGGSKSPARKSRKSNMVNHLAHHGISGVAASELADKWQSKQKKRAFSCGFCIQHFSSITEHLNHIDNEHYKNGQDKASWDISTVVKGLLHQPKVFKYWQKMLASDTGLRESDIWWDLDTAETLRTQLETGDDSGADIALTAYGQRAGTFASTGVTVPVLQRIASRSSSLRSDSFKDSSNMIEQKPKSAPRPKASPTSKHQPGVPSWAELNESQASLQTSHDYHFDQAVDYQNPFQSIGDTLVRLPQHPLAPGGSQNLDPCLPYNYALPTSSLSHVLNPQMSDDPGLQGFLDESGALLSGQLDYPTPSSMNLAQDFNTPGYPGTVLTDVGQPGFGPTTAPHTAPIPTWPPMPGSRSNSLEKPLPALPASEEGNGTSNDIRPRSPMDVDGGLDQR